MKKTIFTLVVAFCVFASVNAQDLVSKKGVPILPEKGDYALGIDAGVFLSYAGNLFNGNLGNAAPAFNFTANNPLTLYGKYFVDDKTAYRLLLRIGNRSTTSKSYVIQDGQTNPTVTKEDKWKQSEMNIAIGAGLEKRRGKGRVQGVYGAMALIEYGTFKDVYEYGNDFTATNVSPTSTNFGGNIIGFGPGRYTEKKQGSSFSFGVGCFAGVEYFIAPKMSIGGELGWGINFASSGEGEDASEDWDAVTSAVKKTTDKVAGGSALIIDTSNFGGCINFLFYF